MVAGEVIFLTLDFFVVCGKRYIQKNKRRYLKMRLLGVCPNCGKEDTIFRLYESTLSFDDFNKAKCVSCETVWPDWLHLKYEERRKGNELIPLEIQRFRGANGEEMGIHVAWPTKAEIPWAGMIVSTLNAALITRFQLNVCLATEGGVEGKYKGEYLELRNDDTHLGLYLDSPYYRQGEGVRRIFNFYYLMLKYLFDAGPENVGGAYRRGEILRLSKEKKDFERAWQILAEMLVQVKNEEFAQKVVGQIKGTQRNPFWAHHLAGL